MSIPGQEETSGPAPNGVIVLGIDIPETVLEAVAS
jgi:hypothetical protein